MKSIDRNKLPDGATGAAADNIVDCFTLAEEVLGPRVKDRVTGLLTFAYLYRRFGPPVYPHDKYKNIAAYCLTTEDPDVWLMLRCAANAVELDFAYLAGPALVQKIRAPLEEHEKQIVCWIAEHVAIEHPDLVTERDDNGNPVALSDAGWLMAHQRRWEPGPDRWGPESWTGRARVAVGERPKVKGTPAHQRLVTALTGAMKALLEPVYVRDVAINLFGLCEEATGAAG